jgi:hypothetical protein
VVYKFLILLVGCFVEVVDCRFHFVNEALKVVISVEVDVHDIEDIT